MIPRLAPVLAAVLVVAGSAVAAQGPPNPGTTGTYTDDGSSNGFFQNEATGFEVSVGECKQGTRVVNLQNVSVVGKEPAFYYGESAKGVDCTQAGNKTTTLIFQVFCRDADGNITGGFRVFVTVAYTEPGGQGTAPLLDGASVFILFGTSVVDTIFFDNPDQMK
jgi:hypothetical protein